LERRDSVFEHAVCKLMSAFDSAKRVSSCPAALYKSMRGASISGPGLGVCIACIATKRKSGFVGSARFQIGSVMAPLNQSMA